MKAKEYLRQVELMNIKIDTKIKQLEELKILATCTGAINAKPDKIQSSPCGDKMENAVAKYVDLEREINNQIDYRSFVNQHRFNRHPDNQQKCQYCSGKGSASSFD